MYNIDQGSISALRQPSLFSSKDALMEGRIFEGSAPGAFLALQRREKSDLMVFLGEE